MSTSGDAFAALVPYWELFETTGVNGAIVSFADVIRSDVLVLGSGQGLVSRTLVDAGYDVTSVDLAPDMGAYALQRRNVPTIIADATTVCLGRRFRTIIVNTGIITEESVDGVFMDHLLGNIERHLDPDGAVLVAYFTASRFTNMQHLLHIHGPNATNHLFWQSRASLDLIKQAYIAHGYDATLIEHLWRKYARDLNEHRQFIMQLGEAYMRLHETQPPADFINLLAGFGAQYLSSASEQALLARLNRAFELVRQAKIEQHTHMVIYKPKG